MAHNLKCPDCGHPVGWGVNDGECPRNMQNFQNEACKARQVVWLKAQRDAALECLNFAERAFLLATPVTIETLDSWQELRAKLNKILVSPARTDPQETNTQPG